MSSLNKEYENNYSRLARPTKQVAVEVFKESAR